MSNHSPFGFSRTPEQINRTICAGLPGHAAAEVLKSMEVRQSDVPAQLQRLDSALSHLDDRLHLLRERLSTVTRAAGPEVSAVNSDEKGATTQVGSDIQLAASKAGFMADLVQDILDRLEL